MKNHYINCRAILLVLVFAAALSACSKKSDPEPQSQPTVADKPADPVPPVTPPVVPPVVPPVTVFTYNYASLSDTLQSYTYNTYISSNGNYFKKDNTSGTGFNYWPNAHALDVLTDGYLRTNYSGHLIHMKALLTGIKAQNGNTYSNEYYDDMGWLGNATLRDYLITNDAAYLDVAQTIYAEIKTGSNTTMGGGIAWRKSQLYYKNIPTTGNMCILAARFYKLQNKPEDLALATSLYDWMKTYLVKSFGQVQDGINRNNDGKVDNWVFTYNQGLFIGSAVELYNITKDPKYLQDAVLTANNELVDGSLTKNGILKDEGQGDSGLFKGVVVRYLTQLIEVADLNASTSTNYIAFLQKNARSLYLKGIARPSYLINSDWAALPGVSIDLSTQLSGVMLMEAAAKLKAEGKME